MLARIAWRNLWRHRGRTLIMTSAVALTYALALLGISIGDDSHNRMLHEAISAAGGDVLVHRAGYWESRAGDAIIAEADTVVETVAAVEGVGTAMPRVLANALLSTSAGARPALLFGVDPERERALRDPADDLTAGTFLTGERDDPLVIGSRLAEELELGIGDRVVLTASEPDGELTRALFHVTGIIETGARQLDEVLAYTTIPAARRALAMEGALTQVGVVAADGDADRLAGAIAVAVNAEGNDLEVLSWREAVPEMVGFIELDDAFGYLFMAVIFVVVLFSITNTFLMAVMERVRELGLLAALGMNARRVGHLIVWETILLTAVAMVAGLMIGFGAHLAVDHWGISVASYGLEEIEISGVDIADLVIYSTINPVKWLLASLIVAVATIASGLYPAWRATRLEPAEAMRFYE